MAASGATSCTAHLMLGVNSTLFPLCSSTVIGRANPDGSAVDLDLGNLAGGNYVSRRHARIWSDGEQRWWIEDLGSSAGTFITLPGENAPTRVNTVSRLTHGCHLRFATTDFVFLEQARPAANNQNAHTIVPPQYQAPGAPQIALYGAESQARNLFAVQQVQGGVQINMAGTGLTGMNASSMLTAFFNRDTWRWALIPALVLCIFAFLAPMNFDTGTFSGDVQSMVNMSAGPQGSVDEMVKAQSAFLGMKAGLAVSAGLIVPFGLSIGSGIQSALNELLPVGQQVTVGGGFLTGTFAVFIGCLLAGLLTRRCRIALLVIGPLTVYGIANVILMNLLIKIGLQAAASQDSSGLTGMLGGLMGMQVLMFPYAWQLLGGSLIGGTAALLVLRTQAQRGVIAMRDCGPHQPLTLENLFAPGLAVHVDAIAATPGSRSLSGASSAVVVTGRAVLDSAQASVSDNSPYLRRCVACPYCGTTTKGAKVPFKCRTCERMLATLLEPAGGTACAACHGYLVSSAHFCHGCGAIVSS